MDATSNSNLLRPASRPRPGAVLAGVPHHTTASTSTTMDLDPAGHRPPRCALQCALLVGVAVASTAAAAAYLGRGRASSLGIDPKPIPCLLACCCMPMPWIPSTLLPCSLAHAFKKSRPHITQTAAGLASPVHFIRSYSPFNLFIYYGYKYMCTGSPVHKMSVSLELATRLSHSLSDHSTLVIPQSLSDPSFSHSVVCSCHPPPPCARCGPKAKQQMEVSEQHVKQAL
jgi:hypothetical protein